MSLPKDDAATLSARWTEGVLLKRDVFSTVERGRFRESIENPQLRVAAAAAPTFGTAGQHERDRT